MEYLRINHSIMFLPLLDAFKWKNLCYMNSIFQDRLYDELDRTIIVDFLVDIKLHLEPLLIANKLDIHIAPAVLQLIRDPDYGSSL